MAINTPQQEHSNKNNNHLTVVKTAKGRVGYGSLEQTLDSTSALWSFCRRRAAALVSSFRAAMCSAGRRTFPFVSFSSSSETTWSWPCCSATARGVNPSCAQAEMMVSSGQLFDGHAVLAKEQEAN